MARTREQVIADCFATGEVQFESDVVELDTDDLLSCEVEVRPSRGATVAAIVLLACIVAMVVMAIWITP